MCACLPGRLAKYLLNQSTDLNEMLRKEQPDKYLELINFWSQYRLRCPPQLSNISKHQNGADLVRFKTFKLKCGVIVAETLP